MPTHEALQTSELLKEKLRNPYILPTFEEIRRAFSLQTGSQVDHEWLMFCLKQDPEFFCFYELINKEFIDLFSEYLVERASIYSGNTETPITVLEVGAGSGRLAHFIRRSLTGHEETIYVATDSGHWNIPILFRGEVITGKDHHASLQEYQPTIVIASWMPESEDWTTDFRAKPSVREYLLIGETDWGYCGNPWLTWGPPYILDGFERFDLDDISKYQICWSDGSPYHNIHSKTVSFRRK